MDGPSHHFLDGAGLAGDDHGQGRGRDAGQLAHACGELGIEREQRLGQRRVASGYRPLGVVFGAVQKAVQKDGVADFQHVTVAQRGRGDLLAVDQRAVLGARVVQSPAIAVAIQVQVLAGQPAVGQLDMQVASAIAGVIVERGRIAAADEHAAEVAEIDVAGRG